MTTPTTDRWEVKNVAHHRSTSHIYEEGWEPFAVTDGTATVHRVWLRRKVNDDNDD